MICKKCSSQVKKEWNFCPHCGDKVRRGINLSFKFSNPFRKESSELNLDMETMFNQVMNELNDAFGEESSMNENTRRKVIRIPMHPEKRQHTSNEVRKKEPMRKHVPVREVEKVVEPKSNVRKTSEGLEISFELPDVTSVNDIVLRKFSESLELRAYAGKKMYFKVIPLGDNNNILKKIFEQGLLKLYVSE